jgi:hypothetical protein
MTVRREDDIVRGIWVCSCLRWIQEGDEGSNFYFDFLKRKLAVNKCLVSVRLMILLLRTLLRSGMINSHFQNKP